MTVATDLASHPKTSVRESPQPATKLDAAAALHSLRGFIGKSQLHAIDQGCWSEERQYFYDKLVEMAGIVTTMPETYEQDGLGDNAIAHLHYFKGSCDWYITEKDSEPDGQHQAYGLANLGYGGEIGYISIVELIELDVELDLHFTPCTLAEIKVRETE
jgi:Protein of unknown function (DUF2958)